MPRPEKKERNTIIKDLYKKGKTQAAIAEIFGIDRVRVTQILNGTSTKKKSKVIHRAVVDKV
jgi:DNA-directed RNA polymerase specialized sigma subunit